MAKKKTEEPESPISKEKTDYGFDLRLYPFRGLTGGMDAMVIRAEITRPKTGRKATIKYWFSGVVGAASLTQAQLGLWNMALRSLMDEATKVGESMRPSRAT